MATRTPRPPLMSDEELVKLRRRAEDAIEQVEGWHKRSRSAWRALVRLVLFFAVPFFSLWGLGVAPESAARLAGGFTVAFTVAIAFAGLGASALLDAEVRKVQALVDACDAAHRVYSARERP